MAVGRSVTHIESFSSHRTVFDGICKVLTKVARTTIEDNVSGTKSAAASPNTASSHPGMVISMMSNQPTATAVFQRTKASVDS